MHSKSNLYIFMVLLFSLTACAQKGIQEQMEDKRSKTRPHSSSLASETFYLHHRSPEPQLVNKWEFYFKHCRLVERIPFPTRDEYNCSEPY
ncbi:MAG: hypothetical protein LW875_09685 [Proteobacteria bacterium]|nr:hypothetical protein [Pseudomonadota bacterium]